MDHLAPNCNEPMICKMDTYFCLCFLHKIRNQSSTTKQSTAQNSAAHVEQY